MKNILALVHDDTGQEARLQVALDITRALSGHLTCVDVTVLPPPMYGDVGMYGEAAVIEYEQRTESANRKLLEARLQLEDVSWGWIDSIGELTSCIDRAADLTDLIVLSTRIEDVFSPDMRTVAAEVLKRSRAPIMAVPEKALGFSAAGHALVAFNGSAESRSALQRAVPLLKLASNVTIAEINIDSRLITHDSAASYLSRHGIKPTVHRESTVRSVPDALLDTIDRERADYVVMGGFGHNQLAEKMLGGVSHRMLGESPVPIFMSH